MGNSFVLFYVSMELSPRKFHSGEVHFTQKVFFSLGNTCLRMSKTASVTVATDKTKKTKPFVTQNVFIFRTKE